MFTHHARIYLHHTDAAGRLFFASQFFFVHEAKEHFLISLGLSVKEILEHLTVTFPIVHVEADYKAMLVTGDEIDILVKIEKIGETSVVFGYTIMKGPILAGTARIVSVTVDKRTQQKVPVPAEWRRKLEKGM